MPAEEYISQDFQLGQGVFDADENKLGKVQARFHRYILIERGGLFGKTYYVPHTLLVSDAGKVHVTVDEKALRERGYHQVPDDLYEEVPEPGIPQVFSSVPQFASRPLSPAQTGHYSYGRRWPGINTDAAGSYHREEVMPIPQKTVEVSERKQRPV